MLDDASDDRVNNLKITAKLDLNAIGQVNRRVVRRPRSRCKLNLLKRRLVLAAAVDLAVSNSASLRTATTSAAAHAESFLPLVKRRL